MSSMQIENKAKERTGYKLVFNLAKNDFKSRFAGSYFGVVWAFVNPVVTVLLYWFVFTKALPTPALRTKSGLNAPYVLWLIAGLVPWFYFSEAWSMGTNCLYEYSYLVKKVVFNIRSLPVVKIVSSLFVHFFFLGFALILAIVSKFYPSLYWLQLIYYLAAMLVFTLGLTYATSALVVFFRDLGQIIAIMMQVIMWMTPILWNFNNMHLNPIIMLILKLNPMFYIVSGYRDSIINNVAFWEKPELTIYYWAIALLFFFGGKSLFKKLQGEFADVL